MGPYIHPFLSLQAVELIFQHRTAWTVDYCETFLPPQLMHWKTLLDMLCDSCSSALLQPTSSSLLFAPPTQYHSPSPESTLYLSLYRGKPHPLHIPSAPIHFALHAAALGHVVALCTTEEFLGLLPPSGSLSFFLPFIEKSCKLELSAQLAQHLTDTPAS